MGTSNVLWVIQTNRLGQAGAHDIFKLTSFLEAGGISYAEVQYRPFDDSPIEVAWMGPTVFYGGTTFIERVYKTGKYKPGVWYDEPAFNFAALLRHYGERMLNSDSRLTSLEELMDETGDEPIFVRPVLDMKEFVGAVRTRAEIRRDLSVASSVNRATPTTLVQVAAPKKLKREWRTIVVNQQVVAGSLYRDEKNRLLGIGAPRSIIPSGVFELAETCAQRYSPAPVFVLDVGELDDGALRVIETNCFNCAGWYESNFRDIVAKVTAFAATY